MNILRGTTISVLMVVFYFINIISAQTSESITDGHDLNNKSYDIRVALDHIFISKKNNYLDISEIVVFRNEGQEINYSKDNHKFFAISTPPDAKNLKTQAMECCLVQEEGMVYIDPMQPIARGANFEIQVSYTLPWNSEYVFNKSVVYNTTSILMFINKKGGMSIDGSNETLVLAGNEYKVKTFNNLTAGETVSIPVKIPQESDYLYAGIGLFFLFSVGSIYYFRGRKKRFTLEELEIEKRKIFKTIYAFEKHAGSESSEEYKKLMEEYRKEAIKVFIKIDNLKKISQSKLLENGIKHA